MSGEKKRVLAFDLFSGIWPQSQLLTKTLAQLDPEKFEVTYVSCGTLLASYCTVMESRKRPLGRGLSVADCMDCKFSAGLNNSLLSKLRVSTGKTIFLSQYSQHEDDAIVHDLSRLVVEQGYPIDFDYQGIPLVRLALYETMLRYKKLKTDINPQES